MGNLYPLADSVAGRGVLADDRLTEGSSFRAIPFDLAVRESGVEFVDETRRHLCLFNAKDGQSRAVFEVSQHGAQRVLEVRGDWSIV